METNTAKQELIDWISTLQDEQTLLLLKSIKYEATFSFDEEFKKGIPFKDAKQKSLEKVSVLWKK